MKKRYFFRVFTLPILLTLLLISGVSTSSAISGEDNPQQTSYEKLNLLILVRASQSSSHKINTLSYSKTRLEIIQEAIPLVLEQYSFQSNINIGIMAIGHNLDQNNYELSCSTENVEMVVPFQLAAGGIDFTRFNGIEGLGYSPTLLALEEAGKLFPPASDEVLNVVLLIADGSDTCAENPVAKARELADSKKIVIHAIGFMADTKGSKELSDIANQTLGSYLFISPYIGDNDLAISELTNALSSVFDSLLAQISEPSPTNTVTPTEAALLTPVLTDTPIPTSTQTEVPPQPTPEPISTEPIPTEEQPSSPSSLGILVIVIVIVIIIVAVLATGFFIWRSRRPTIPTDETPAATEITITTAERLEQFRKDLFKAYFSIEAKKHNPKFIPLKEVKDELSKKYTSEQFDELLVKARRKYPNNIWIDRDSMNKPVFIKIER